MGARILDNISLGGLGSGARRCWSVFVAIVLVFIVLGMIAVFRE